jgi:hypothetical protein
MLAVDLTTALTLIGQTKFGYYSVGAANAVMATEEAWHADLERWLEPFWAGLTHRTMLPLYISGLIGPGDRKSVRPMTARDRAVCSHCHAALHLKPQHDLPKQC